jgi:hypothetical protein
MARIYTRKAAQKKLAAMGAAKVTHAAIIVPPAEIMGKNSALWAGWWTRQGLNL